MPGKPLSTPRLLGVFALALGLAACGRSSDDEVLIAGPQASPVAAEPQADERADRRREPATDGASAWQEMRSEAGDRVADAAITASVNAELAKDDDLSSLRVDVDTQNGHVLLKGSAPSPQSRERASRIAGSVRGVTSVDNQLAVQP